MCMVNRLGGALIPLTSGPATPEPNPLHRHEWLPGVPALSLAWKTKTELAKDKLTELLVINDAVLVDVGRIE